MKSSYLQGLPQLPRGLVKKLAAGERASDAGDPIAPHEPRPAEKVRINKLAQQIRSAREEHERETGELIEVEKPLLPGELPPED